MSKPRGSRRAIALLITCLSATAVPAGDSQANSDYLQVVRAYADALLEHGRDVYGVESSPLVATTLDRKNLRLFAGKAADEITNIAREDWGIRSHDRMVTGANPMHDQNLYQILYALSALTGEDRYQLEANRTLKWFFERCQSEETGLMAWGEHIGWDFNTETIIDKKGGRTHEFFRPWVLWESCFSLTPGACGRFARGVWEHQIGDRNTGNFSRHARWDKHGPGLDSEYPRHGGFYIGAWAHAYAESHDPVFLEAIETLLNYFEGRRNPTSEAIPAESTERSSGKMMWPGSNLSLAVDLENGASLLAARAESLAKAMRSSASTIDRNYLQLPHRPAPGNEGFIKTAYTETLQPMPGGHTQLWATGYGDTTTAAMADLCLLRYRQVPLEGYRSLILSAAANYLESEPNREFPLYPGTFGDVIFLLLGAYELTGEENYRARAHHFARVAIEEFLPDESPLPRATSAHNHYEAITRADTLMMALLKLWIVENKPKAEVSLVYCDR